IKLLPIAGALHYTARRIVLRRIVPLQHAYAIERLGYVRICFRRRWLRLSGLLAGALGGRTRCFGVRSFVGDDFPFPHLLLPLRIEGEIFRWHRVVVVKVHLVRAFPNALFVKRLDRLYQKEVGGLVVARAVVDVRDDAVGGYDLTRGSDWFTRWNRGVLDP